MNFEQLLLKLANDDDAKQISQEQLLEALEVSFPRERRTRLLAHTADSVVSPLAELPGIAFQNGAYHPKDVGEVQTIVAFARSKKRRMRVAGAQHSTTPAVYSNDHHDLRVVLDGSLREITFLSNGESGATVLVGGGCYLGVNPADPSSTLENSLNAVLDEHNYALPVLGGISHQTVAGFLQTCSSGGSLAHGFAEAVQAIELVDGTGNVQWLQIGSDAFQAAAVSVGLFGVITHVVLAVSPRYFVKGTETNHEESDSLLQKTNGSYPLSDAIASTEYLHLNWFPQRFVRRVTQWEGTRTAVVSPADPYESELKSTWMNVVAAAVLALTSGALGLDPDSPIVQRIVGALLRKFVPLDKNETFDDRWFTVLPCDDQVKVDTLIKIIFTEIWLPLDQLTPALDRLNVILEDQVVAGNFAVELYGAQRSPFWLSPSFDRDVFRVDVFWWAYSFGDPRQHFAHFWNALLDLPGARLHWGKQLPDVGTKYGNIVFGPDFLKDRYSRLKDWLELRKQLDPDGVFVTAYWQRILGI